MHPIYLTHHKILLYPPLLHYFPLFSFSGTAAGLGNAHFGPGTGPIFLDDVTCSGNEDTITTCSFAGYGQSDCDHSEDASVICDAGRVFFTQVSLFTIKMY